MYPAGLHFVLGVSTGLAQYFIWMVYTLVMYWPPRAKRRLIITLTLLLKDTTSQRCYLLYCIILQVYVCNVYCVTYHCALQVHQSVAIHNRGRSRERLEIDDENRSIRHEILPVEVPGSIQIGTSRETKVAPIIFTNSSTRCTHTTCGQKFSKLEHLEGRCSNYYAANRPLQLGKYGTPNRAH